MSFEDKVEFLAHLRSLLLAPSSQTSFREGADRPERTGTTNPWPRHQISSRGFQSDLAHEVVSQKMGPLPQPPITLGDQALAVLQDAAMDFIQGIERQLGSGEAEGGRVIGGCREALANAQGDGLADGLATRRAGLRHLPEKAPKRQPRAATAARGRSPGRLAERGAKPGSRVRPRLPVDGANPWRRSVPFGSAD